MNFNLIISDSAEVEVIEAFIWYEDKKIGLGEKFFEELDILFEYIISNPFLFPVKRKKIYHEAVLKKFPFVVIYVIDEMDVVILSVFKTPQNPENKPA